MAAHVQTERGARAAVDAGVASIEHGWALSDEDLSLAVKNHVTLVSTDFTVDELLANGMDARLPGARIDTIRAMTSRAVELLGVASERGSLATGMASDLVATPANPLDDINGLKRINFVMKNGEIYRRP